MRNLSDLLVHLLRKSTSLSHTYLSLQRDHCLVCEEVISESLSYAQFRVCPTCRFHYSLTARERIDLMADKGTFRETNRSITSLDPLTFSSRSSSSSRLSQDRKRTGLTDAVVTGHCSIGKHKAILVVLDFGFMGGTMGSIAGEKVALAFEAGAKSSHPVIAIVTGGGLRIQEGVLSLMQMAKTVMAFGRLQTRGLPLLVILANPATGQAYSSFANLADVILAEPGSLIGLAPMRALKEATKKPIPLDAHTAEAHLNHGLLDGIVDREELREKIITVLNVLGPQRGSQNRDTKVERFKLPQVRNGSMDIFEASYATSRTDRPTARDYIRAIMEDFFELRGDRVSGDDHTLIGGMGYLRGQRIAILGQEQRGDRGGDGMYHAYPSGFRKAQRIINLAVHFKIPVVTFIDTQGAHPGLEAEEQGIGNAIATTLSLMANALTPIVAVIVGESGSEGALALSLADRVLMQQYAVFSPVSSQGASGRFHRDDAKHNQAAQAMMLTAQECSTLGIVDTIVPEPEGGAHNDPLEAAQILQLVVAKELATLGKSSVKKLVSSRHRRFRRMGELSDVAREALGREIFLLEHMVTRDTPKRDVMP